MIDNKLLILWTSGVNKLKIANFLFLTAVIVTLIQIILAVIITPTALNKSRSILRDSNVKEISSIIKSNDFSDSFEQITFYVDKKNVNGEMINIFIRDDTNALSSIISESEGTSNTTVFAKKGLVKNNKLILFDELFKPRIKLEKLKMWNLRKLN